MASKKYQRDIAALIKGEGVEVVDVKITSGDHYKFICRFKNDRRFFITSQTPSDRRTLLNLRSDVRRWMKEVSHVNQ